MKHKYDEIKDLIKASKKILTNSTDLIESDEIKKRYGIISEQRVDLESQNVTKKINVGRSIEDRIDYDTYEDEEESETTSKDRKQAYRISGGLLVLHGKLQVDLELTTDEKIAFQETMEEFINEVSDLVDFDNLNVYPNNVTWSGKIIEYDLDFSYSIGEDNGVYINANMIKTDDKFLDLITKLKSFYDKFKAKWSKILSSRKKTKKFE
jgi:hypothetical protein